jgi:hypothetical protein
MTAEGKHNPADEHFRALAQDRFQSVRAIACATTPTLAGLAHFVRVAFNPAVQVAAVGPTGLVLLNPEMFATGDLMELAFVFSHELMHLALDSHRRGEGVDPGTINIAHDCVINWMLTMDYGIEEPPFGGCILEPEFRGDSLEMVVSRMLAGRRANPVPDGLVPWGLEGEVGGVAGPGNAPGHRRVPGPLEEAFARAGISMPVGTEPGTGERSPVPGGTGLSPHQKSSGGDLLSAAEESRLESGLTEDQRAELAGRLRQLAREANEAEALRQASMEVCGRGDSSGDGSWQVNALRRGAPPSWHLAIQRWLDQTEPGRRSYHRASRKAGQREDIVLPGRNREGWQLNVVLDTSGSMVDQIPPVLGALATFCEAAGVGSVRVIQCDTEVSDDRRMDPSELSEFRALGGGGSNMGPALKHLAGDPETRAVLVLTDGDIDIPEAEPPFSILWALVGNPDYSEFYPTYGRIVWCGDHAARADG